MSPHALFADVLGGGFLLVKLAVGASGGPTMPKGLSIRNEPHRVVIQWNGDIEAPMRDKIAEALEDLENDPRAVVLSINSNGGSVQHGREVVKALRKASYARAIDTMVEKGSICASMCVPIYLVGAERMAHPAARFMFHQTRLRLSAEDEQRMTELSRETGMSLSEIKRKVIEMSTDDLFEVDIGMRSVDRQWAENMRRRISNGGDVWLNAKQLQDQGSSMIDKLL